MDHALNFLGRSLEVVTDYNSPSPICRPTDDIALEYHDQRTLQGFAERLLNHDYHLKGFSDLLVQTTLEDRGRFLFCDGVPRVYQYSLDPPGFMISPRFEGIQGIAKELVMEVAYAEDKYFSRLWRGGDFVRATGSAYRDYQKYTVETFGVRITVVPETYLHLGSQSLQPSRLPRYWLTSRLELIQIRRIRVLSWPLEYFDLKLVTPLTPTFPNCPYLEERWNPKNWERLSIGGFHRSELNFFDEIERFRREASRILARQRNKLGRPEGTTQYSKESFRSTAKRIYCEELMKTGIAPSRKLLALRMGLSKNAFKTNWRKTRLPWPPPAWSTSI